MDYEAKLKDLLVTTAKENASDLHLAVGRKPTLRIDGSLVPFAKEEILTPEAAEGLILAMLSSEQKERLAKERQIDFAYTFEDKARFRVNAYYQRGFLAAALRLIPSRIRSAEELGLPPIVHDFSKLSQGFVLVVGPAGHGKSTTLAAVLDDIEQEPTRKGYGEGLVELGGSDERVVVLTADLAGSTTASKFQEKFPGRFVEVGIAEQNMIGVLCFDCRL
jgi:twitching motility protein PilT